ncbi:MAG: hypothetical protein CBE43_10065 [Rhodopirellula sp. TMED283]|nr:MAG: hypothetical protein CBE43_10065 [Rhodopirellula sp. TMED283]
MDDRSDAKGPEPECVTTGVIGDDTLAFIGLERTGGIVTYKINDPANAEFQDFLNVRNWLVGETVPEKDDAGWSDYYVQKSLNDGPESFVFISAADSPVGVPLLLAVTPMAGRLTVYTVEDGGARPDDGSCKNTATCPYVAAADGGTGAARGRTSCGVCVGDACTTLGCPAAASSKKKGVDEGVFVALVLVAAVLGGVALAGCGMAVREHIQKEKYHKLLMKPMNVEAA